MRKKKTLASIVLVIIALAMLSSFGVFMYDNGNMAFMHPLKEAKEGQIKVACVGDSITYGAGVHGWPKKSYPYILENLLGEGYIVNNYGYSARTAMSDGDRPYIADKLYDKSLAYQPDILVIMFGTNDSKPYNWKGKEAFIQDYSDLIDSYINLDSAPEVYILAPPPAFAFKNKVMFNIDAQLIDNEIYTAVEEIAMEKSLNFVDMNTVFSGRNDLFLDGIHPNNSGAKLFAQTVAQAILADKE